MPIHDNADTTESVRAVVSRAKDPKCPGGCRGTGWRYVPGPTGDMRAACPCNPTAEPEAPPEDREAPKNLKCPGGCRGSGVVWVTTSAGDRKAPCAACRPKARAEFNASGAK